MSCPSLRGTPNTEMAFREILSRSSVAHYALAHYQNVARRGHGRADISGAIIVEPRWRDDCRRAMMLRRWRFADCFMRELLPFVMPPTFAIGKRSNSALYPAHILLFSSPRHANVRPSFIQLDNAETIRQ